MKKIEIGIKYIYSHILNYIAIRNYNSSSNSQISENIALYSEIIWSTSKKIAYLIAL